ncbi:uncharacterized protein LOC144927891 isoform X4 [Branchiostoma floridae x Branchiostoma belcheri]
MASNDPQEYLQPDHQYEDVDLKLNSGNVILLSGLKHATPPELPPRNVNMGGAPVVRPGSMEACPSQHCNTQETQGDGHKGSDEESEDTDQMFEEVNQKTTGSQRDRSSEPPSGHLDAGDHIKEETQQERTDRGEEEEKRRAGKPATKMWTKAKSFQVCLFILGCGLMVISLVFTGKIILSTLFTPGSMLKKPATPLMMILDEGDSSSVAYSTSAPFSTLQLKNSATSPMMILEEGDSSTVGYATLHILAHGGESTELSTDIGFHAVPPPYPVLIWPSITATCKIGWREYNDNCYKLGETKLSWFKAREECNKHGANLASIQSREENNFLKYFVKKVLRPRPSRSSCQVWIGLRNERGWHWAHGARLTYTNWAPGEPSGKGFWLTAREDCGSMYTMKVGAWDQIGETAFVLDTM